MRTVYVKKFTFYRIAEHFALVVLFAILAATGLAQKFHSIGISQSLILALGGIDSVRTLHHGAGIFFTALTVEHVLVNLAVIFFQQAEPSMLISFKDAQDALHNMRYYLGLADQPAEAGRYGYKEKFIYWLILLCGTQQVITGFLLWFPVAATKYLPGQFIPAAKAVHTNEAMLIFLLSAIWHVYDSMFSPEVFPLNKSIFTGYEKRKTNP